MKRKFLVVILAIVATFCMAFGLSACGEKSEEEPEKEQADLWSMERVYATAQELGFKGTLEELIAMFKGEKGENGKDGKDGLGIQSLEIDENGHLKVTLSDGTVKDAGKVTPDASPAEEGTEGLQYQKRKDEEGNEYAAVTGLGTAWETDIVIPSTYRSLPVKEIEEYAFASSSSSPEARSAALTSITIPDSLTLIGEGAFSGCEGLKEVHISDLAAWCRIKFEDFAFEAYHLFVDGEEITELEIPNGVTAIGEYAFANCERLTSVTIPDSVTEIGRSVFSGCSGLTSVTIPNGVTEIGNNAFSGCSGLTSIAIPDSVTEIGKDAFFDTAYYNNNSNWTGDVLYIGKHLIIAKDTITGSYSIRGGTKTIANSAFLDCSGLTSVTIPNSMTEIGYRAFYGCSGLTSVKIPNSVTEIGDNAFSGCSELTTVTIGSGVTSIGYGAFEWCSGLSSVTIPDSVTAIGEWAFAYCRELTSVTIGSGVTSIGYRAFEWCNLKEVHFENPNGWKASRYEDMSGARTVSGLDDPATAAQYLTGSYCYYYWKREG